MLKAYLSVITVLYFFIGIGQSLAQVESWGAPINDRQIRQIQSNSSDTFTYSYSEEDFQKPFDARIDKARNLEDGVIYTDVGLVFCGNQNLSEAFRFDGKTVARLKKDLGPANKGELVWIIMDEYSEDDGVRLFVGLPQRIRFPLPPLPADEYYEVLGTFSVSSLPRAKVVQKFEDQFEIVFPMSLEWQKTLEEEKNRLLPDIYKMKDRITADCAAEAQRLNDNAERGVYYFCSRSFHNIAALNWVGSGTIRSDDPTTFPELRAVEYAKKNLYVVEVR